MPEQLSYWPRFFKRVFSETVLFTTRKLLVGAVMGITTRIALLEFGKKALEEIKLDTLIFIGSYITATIGSFLINLVRVPALLDAECQAKVSQLNTQLELPDKEQAEYLRGLLAKLSDNGKAVLRFALFHDEITSKQLDTILPLWEDVEKGYRECLDLGLLKYRNDSPDPYSAVRWTWDVFWVPDNFRIPLKRLMSQSRS